MIQIQKAVPKDADVLTILAKKTFMESHGHSAPIEHLTNYLNQHFTIPAFEKQLANPANVYYLLYLNGELIGYSKIIYNQPIEAIPQEKITKLERIYLLEKYHGQGFAQTLFDFNVQLARENDQAGIWLFTWTENKRGIRFYEKLGFVIVGEYDFELSPTHSNPNWQMFLKI